MYTYMCVCLAKCIQCAYVFVAYGLVNVCALSTNDMCTICMHLHVGAYVYSTYRCMQVCQYILK